MASEGNSSVNPRKIPHQFARALSSAFSEWLLIFMLLIDSIFSYLITKFARDCKLQTPCLLCSRLDHVLGTEKLKFYWDLVCGVHKLEISSLVYCNSHNKLVDAHGMCESCLFSFATVNKSNAETYRLLVGKLGVDTDFDNEERKVGHSTTRHCSCCNEPWMPKGYVKTQLLPTQSTMFQATKFDQPLSVPVECGHDNASFSVEATDEKRTGSDPLSHVVYKEPKVSSDSKSEVSSDAEDDNFQTEHLKRDIVDQYVLTECGTTNIVLDDSAVEKSVDPVSASKPSTFNSESQTGIIVPLITKSVDFTDASGNGLEELNWKQVTNETKPSVIPELISFDDAPFTSNGREPSFDVSIDMNVSSLYKVPPRSNTGEIPIQGSDDYMSSSSLGNQTPVEVSKESKPVSIDYVSPLVFVKLSSEESKEIGVTRTLEVKQKSVTECEEIYTPRAKPPPVPESPVKTNHVASETSIQVNSSLDLTDAYKLAIGSRGRQLSGLIVEQWTGKDSSRLSEDLKVLLSQLSAARGTEQSMNDVSPRISVNNDELKASDASAYNGTQILQKRISLERNESGLSLDGSIVSEIEGESVVDRLKRQVEHDRKLLHALYTELEEERNASAIAANQAMAMITRLQEEKATLHMEALQNLRMMEEQAEYDMEALQSTNDLLAEKEKEIHSLEAELKFYTMKFSNESMPEASVTSADDLKARKSAVDHS